MTSTAIAAGAGAIAAARAGPTARTGVTRGAGGGRGTNVIAASAIEVDGQVRPVSGRVRLSTGIRERYTYGQPVRVTLDAYPQKIFDGKVRFVAPAAQIAGRLRQAPRTSMP